MTTRAVRLVGFTLTLLVLSASAYAEDRDEATGASGVTLYEISERVTFDQAQGVILRNATPHLCRGLPRWGAHCARRHS